MNSPAAGLSAGDPRPLRILAITRKPESASFEQRVTNYVAPLAKLGVEVACKTLPHSPAGQWLILGEARQYDAVWWHRHLLTGWIRPRLWQAARKVVYDFDDPMPLSAADGGKPSFIRGRRFAGMLSGCDMALAASSYLRELAAPHCKQVVILPMAIDLPQDLAPAPVGETVELLWLGQRSTQPFLDQIRPVLEELARSRPNVRLRLVAHEKMSFGKLPVDYRPWSHDEQEKALRQCHIGLCPMPDTPWTRGKNPYKVLQYLAYGMPWVGSAVGENLITAGVAGSPGATGLCAADTGDWFTHLTTLIDNPALRLAMGQAGRAYAQAQHDRQTLAQRLAEHFRTLCPVKKKS